MSSAKKLLLFDIDGTLLLTGGCGKIAFEKAFEELFHVKESWGNVIPDGKTDPVIIDEISEYALGRKLNSKEHDRLCERYLFYFRESIQNPPSFKLMPGVATLLAVLQKRPDLVLGIATGNLEEAGWLKLKRGDIQHYFEFGGFGSDSHIRSEIVQKAIERGERISKCKFEAKQIYVIGDTAHDIRAAQKVGAKSIGITTGGYKKEELLEEKADYVLETFESIELFFNCL